MTKQEQFLWVVQTSMLGQTQEKPISLSLALEAIKASERVPQDKTLAEAATDFCEWSRAIMCGEDNPEKPNWF